MRVANGQRSATFAREPAKPANAWRWGLSAVYAYKIWRVRRRLLLALYLCHVRGPHHQAAIDVGWRPKVGELRHTVTIDKDVLRLNVSMIPPPVLRICARPIPEAGRLGQSRAPRHFDACRRPRDRACARSVSGDLSEPSRLGIHNFRQSLSAHQPHAPSTDAR